MGVGLFGREASLVVGGVVFWDEKDLRGAASRTGSRWRMGLRAFCRSDMLFEDGNVNNLGSV